MRQAQFLILTLALPLAAQNATGPALGIAAGADSRSVRILQGVPGASRVAGTADLPADLQLLRLHPTATIAVTTTNGWPLLYDIASGSRTALDGARQNPAGLTWSPLGSAFVLSYPADGRVQVFASANCSYRLADEFALEGPLAVSDDGAAVLTAGSALSLRTTSGIEIVANTAVTAFTFLAGTHTVAYAANTGLMLGTSHIARPLRNDAVVYLGSPAADRLVAFRSSGAVAIFDSNGQTLASGDCGASATGLDLLGRAGSLLLSTGSATAPLCVADTSAAPRIYYIPQPRETAGANQ